jgi:hypothetical protein
MPFSGMWRQVVVTSQQTVFFIVTAMETSNLTFVLKLSYQNGLKQGDALSPLLFNFALEYAIRKAQESQVGLKLNGKHHLPAYADDVNLLGDNIDSINRNTETFLDASKEVGLEINRGRIKNMLPSCHWNAGQNWHIKIANRLF